METKQMERDPVCGMKVDKATCKLVSVHKGKQYRFCTSACQKAFELAPEKYVCSETEPEPETTVDAASIRDLEDMSNILTTAVELSEKEREFFLSEVGSASRPVSKALFTELADKLTRDLEELTERKKKVNEALADLRRIREKSKGIKVEVLVTHTCHHPLILRQQLEEMGIPYSVKYIEDNPELRKKYNLMGSPNIVVNGELAFRGMPPISDLRNYLKNVV